MSSVRLHPPLERGLEHGLAQILAHGYPADKVLERLFRENRKWGGRDRRLVAEILYDCVRWRRRLAWSSELDDSKVADAEALARALVRTYQMVRDESSKSTALARWQSPPSRAVRESIPDWLDEVGELELGEDWDSIISALNQQAPVFLRANRLKTDPDLLAASLDREAVFTEPVPNLPDALRLKERVNVFRTQSFKDGWFEVQDGGSQQIAPFLGVEPGMRVIDACAGAGGKTLHLAALMRNRGQIIAMDVHERKLEGLRLRARRAGVSCVETRLIQSSKTIKRLKESADAVLLDVPCSGLGVLRRNPDQKWRLSVEDLERLQALQADILSRYSAMVKPGGVLVYATCSILPSENQAQVESFLRLNGETWHLEKELVLRPDWGNFDGFYAARLRQRVARV